MRRALLLAACLVLSACVYVPSRQKSAQGQPVTPEQTAFLYDDGMTLARARERLGPPTLDLRDINVAVWSWRTSGDVWFVALPSTPSTGDPEYRDYSLMVAYADDGRVLTHLLEKRGSWDTASEQARKWHRRIAPSLAQAAGSRTSSNRYGLIHVYMPDRGCAPGTVDILLDGQRVAELGREESIVTRATPQLHELRALVGTLAFGLPLTLAVDASRPIYVRVCSAGLLYQPWKVMQAKSAGKIGGADVLRIVDQKTADAEMRKTP